jgi:hypothetical protein
MRTFVLTAIGMGVLLLVVVDVYVTILHARARAGPISETLNRVVWRIALAIASPLSRTSRHRFLNRVGPLLLPSLLIVSIALLVIGFALIYLPRMPDEFNIDSEAKNHPVIDSIYYSSVTLTTVGYGDITPRTTTMRLVALTEAASGITLITLALTYLIAVYGALERKRAVALSFYHQANEGADVAGFITHHFVGGRFLGLETALRDATRDLHGLLESHVEHPVIHYFHPIEVHKGLPRVLFLALETCAVIGSCIEDEEYPETHNHPELRTLEASARYVLKQLVTSLDLERRMSTRKETYTDEEERWRQRFEQTMRRLQRDGIVLRRDRQAAWAEYRAQRSEWEAQLHRFAIYLGYDWDEVTGDSDLRIAADEES